jgi:hypothetical protein
MLKGSFSSGIMLKIMKDWVHFLCEIHPGHHHGLLLVLDSFIAILWTVYKNKWVT